MRVGIAAFRMLSSCHVSVASLNLSGLGFSPQQLGQDNLFAGGELDREELIVFPTCLDLVLRGSRLLRTSPMLGLGELRTRQQVTAFLEDAKGQASRFRVMCGQG